jgi:transcriptional regulator NrdR family protein
MKSLKKKKATPQTAGLSLRSIIKVEKNDGSLEDFDPGKIAKVIRAAGLSLEEAAVLAARLSSWVVEQDQRTIKSSEIRKKVIAELQEINEYATNLFNWYKRNQDNGKI